MCIVAGVCRGEESGGVLASLCFTGAGTLPFPGTDGDARGFAIALDGASHETGETVNAPTLLTVPQNKVDGYIQGLYPALAIQSGDRFQAQIGCQHGARADTHVQTLSARRAAAFVDLG